MDIDLQLINAHGKKEASKKIGKKRVVGSNIQFETKPQKRAKLHHEN